MARLFDDAQSEYLKYAGAFVSAAPFTVALWSRPDELTSNKALFCIGNTSVENEFFLLYFMPTGDPYLRIIVQHESPANCQTTNEYSANTWHHCAHIEAAANDRTVILDGDLANKGTDTTSTIPAVDTTTIGCRAENGYDLFHSGRIAWPAIWDVALTDAEVVSLASGTHPSQIRPANRVSFWPLGGLDTEETDGGNAIDIWGGYTLTANSDAVGPGIADHPGGLIYPSSPQIVIPTAAAPGGVAPTSHLYGPLVGPLGGAV